MKELFRTNDPVRLSWALAVLRDEGITAVVLDEHMSVVEGSIVAIPRRLAVGDGDVSRAKAALARAEAALDDGLDNGPDGGQS